MSLVSRKVNICSSSPSSPLSRRHRRSSSRRRTEATLFGCVLGLLIPSLTPQLHDHQTPASLEVGVRIMFGRLQTAGVAGGNQQAATGNGGGGQGGGGRNGGSASRNSRNIAGSALKKAGLMDDDVGMRSASSSGPSRRGGRAGRAGQAGAAAGPVSTRIDT